MIEPLAPELDSLLVAQERFERLLQRSARFGRNVCDLAYANPYDGPDEVVVEAMRRALGNDRRLALQYTPYGGYTATRRLVAEQLTQSHGLGFSWRDVVMTPGAMGGLSVVFRSLRTAAGGDEVIVLTPCWLDYPTYLVEHGLRPIFVPLTRHRFEMDLSAIEQALSPSTRAVVFSQPANPTGRLFGADELTALAALLQAHPSRPVIISDECHRDVIYDDAPFVSPASFYDDTCIVYSCGKTLLVQGQRIGYVAISPRMKQREAHRVLLERLCRAMGLCTPTALMQTALQSLLSHKPDLRPFARRRAQLMSELGAAGYEVTPAQATFFLYVRTPMGDDFELAERLAERGVLVLPAPIFHDAGSFRLSLTASDEMIERALPIFRHCRSV